VRRTGPTRQRATAVWPPRAAPNARVKALLAPRSRSPPRAARPPDSRVARTTPPRSRRPTPDRVAPSPLPPPRAPARCPSHRAAVSTPVSRRLPAVSVCRRRAVAVHRAPHAPPAAAVGRVATGRAGAVRVGRVRIRPSVPG
jgi:hypothetical protein